MQNLKIFLARWLQDKINKIEKRYRYYKPNASNSSFIESFGAHNQSPITETATSITAVIKMPDYWKYINYGVKGLKGGRSTRGYSFRNYGLSVAGQRRFREWMRNNRIVPTYGELGEQYAKAKGKQREAALKTLQIKIAKKVKEKGIQPQPFFTDVINKNSLTRLRKDALRQFQLDVRATILSGSSKRR
jgi:hypothetical protein